MFYIKNLSKEPQLLQRYLLLFLYLSLCHLYPSTYQIGSLQRITLSSARLVQRIDVVEVAVVGKETTSLAKAGSVAVAKVRGDR